MLGAVRFAGSSSKVYARTPPVQNSLRGAVKCALYTRFEADKDIMDALVHLRKKRGAGGTTSGKPVLETSLWGMRYVDNAGVVSHSPEQLRKKMGVIIGVCVVFDVTVSRAKTEIMCLPTKEIPESIAMLSLEAAGQVYNQTDELVYLGGNANHNPNLSTKVNRRKRNAQCSFRKYTLKLYDRPSAPFELKNANCQRPRANAKRLRHVKSRACATTTRCAKPTTVS